MAALTRRPSARPGLWNRFSTFYRSETAEQHRRFRTVAEAVASAISPRRLGEIEWRLSSAVTRIDVRLAAHEIFDHAIQALRRRKVHGRIAVAVRGIEIDVSRAQKLDHVEDVVLFRFRRF